MFSVLSQLLRGLSCLNYPPEKLEIKIIVEEFDTNLRRALEKFDLPPHIEVIVVPQGSPQTKPRALNYALQFCHGGLLTIYDAEDVPEPNQLRDVAREFLARNSSRYVLVITKDLLRGSKRSIATRADLSIARWICLSAHTRKPRRAARSRGAFDSSPRL